MSSLTRVWNRKQCLYILKVLEWSCMSVFTQWETRSSQFACQWKYVGISETRSTLHLYRNVLKPQIGYWIVTFSHLKCIFMLKCFIWCVCWNFSRVNKYWICTRVWPIVFESNTWLIMAAQRDPAWIFGTSHWNLTSC